LQAAGWKEILVTEARDRQAGGGRLYLAQVPGVLRPHGVNIREITGDRKLIELLRSEASDVLTVSQDQAGEGGWYLVPRDAERYEPYAGPEPLAQRERASDGSTPQFLRPFWTAFIKRIPPGHRRFVSLDGSRFTDVPETEQPPSGSSDVLLEELADAESVDDPATIHAAVERWIKKRGLNREQFLVKSDRPKRHSYDSPRHQWVLALETLSERDAGRIMIPLDIVLKLLKS